jgi:hypothetical protein
VRFPERQHIDCRYAPIGTSAGRTTRRRTTPRSSLSSYRTCRGRCHRQYRAFALVGETAKHGRGGGAPPRPRHSDRVWLSARAGSWLVMSQS